MRGLALTLFSMAAVGVSAQTTIDIGFAKHGQDHSAKNMVIQFIGEAKFRLRMACYNFTDQDIIGALVAAHKRGVDVQVVHDAKAFDEKGDGTKVLQAAGIPIRLDHMYAIMHHKFIVIDGLDVQTGSFNYSHNADAENAENVIIVRGDTYSATVYESEWNLLFAESKEP